MLTSHQIEEIFDRVCERRCAFLHCSYSDSIFCEKYRLFQIIDSENGQRTAVSKRIPSLKDLFMQCLHFTSSSKTLVALRLTLQTDSQKMRRTVIVKGLYGVRWLNYQALLYDLSSSSSSGLTSNSIILCRFSKRVRTRWLKKYC